MTKSASSDASGQPFSPTHSSLYQIARKRYPYRRTCMEMARSRLRRAGYLTEENTPSERAVSEGLVRACRLYARGDYVHYHKWDVSHVQLILDRMDVEFGLDDAHALELESYVSLSRHVARTFGNRYTLFELSFALSAAGHMNLRYVPSSSALSNRHAIIRSVPGLKGPRTYFAWSTDFVRQVMADFEKRLG